MPTIRHIISEKTENNFGKQFQIVDFGSKTAPYTQFWA